MGFDRVLFYGAFLWVVMFFLGWFLDTLLPSTSHVIIIILGILVVYSFSRYIMEEKNIFSVGFTWLVVSVIFDFIFKIILLQNNSYFSNFGVFVFYAILMIEPGIIKRLSKKA